MKKLAIGSLYLVAAVVSTGQQAPPLTQYKFSEYYDLKDHFTASTVLTNLGEFPLFGFRVEVSGFLGANNRNGSGIGGLDFGKSFGGPRVGGHLGVGILTSNGRPVSLGIGGGFYYNLTPESNPSAASIRYILSGPGQR